MSDKLTTPKIPEQRKMYQPDQGMSLPRVTFRKGRKTTENTTEVPSYLIRCGCCEERFTIHEFGEALSINGVMASKQAWKDLLLPLLEEDKI